MLKVNTNDNELEGGKSYLVTIRAIATATGLGGAARQTACYHFQFMLSCTTGLVSSIAGLAVISPPVTVGAAFVGATLVPSVPGGDNVWLLTFSIDPGLTVAARVCAHAEFVEVLGD